MLKKYNRLAKTKDIDNVFKKGRSSYGSILGVKSLDNNLDFNRFTVVVSNKVSKKAVVRNKIKRQIREVVKQELPCLKIGKDVIILTLPVIVGQKFTDIRENLVKEFKKVSLYKK